MPPPTLYARMRRSLGYRGVRRTVRVGLGLARYRLRHGASAPRPHAFDLEFGTDTVSLAGATNLKGDATLGNGHEPIDTVDFANLMAGLNADVRGFTFIDIGAGQGRASLLASDYPFERIIGIEHGRELYESALANLQRYRNPRQRCDAVECIWADALAWEMPAVPTVFYLCEPFREPLLGRMAARIQQSLGAAPRPAYVLYVGAHAGIWEEGQDFETLYRAYEAGAYRWKAPGGAPA
jgi:hypothetical protein